MSPLGMVEAFGIPVFPCKANAKIPATSRGFHDASRDHDVISRWASTPCNWGMPTGRETFVVIDIDVRPGVDGNDSLATLERNHGRLPDTAVVMTPSGGSHYWFRSSEAIPNSAGKLGKGIDVRGDGGYVLIPPSSIDGRVYQWEASSDPADVGFAELPGWLSKLLRTAPKAITEPETAKGDGIAEGGRNAHLTRLAGSMRRPGMSEQAILAALTQENALRCRPPLPVPEVAIIAKSVSRYAPEQAPDRALPVIQGAAHYLKALQDLHEKGMPGGDRVGWPSVDQHYTVVPGQLSIITGWPGAGKSEWLDAVLLNLARQGWRIAIFSPENKPTELHVAKFIEKMSGKPFGAGPTQRLTLDELREYTDEIRDWFGFVEPREDMASVDDIISAAEPFYASREDNKHGLVIDPWNELEHWRPQGLSETEYISLTLSKIRNWARKFAVHVWIVAHPQKMRREEGKLPVPRPDMISSSQHWWNKADAAITVYRDPEKMDSQDVEIHVQKIRFKHVGRPGLVTLRYDRVTGKYYEQQATYNARMRGEK